MSFQGKDIDSFFDDEPETNEPDVVKYLNNKEWRDRGYLKFYLHPQGRIDRRMVAQFPTAILENKDGEETSRLIPWQRYVSPDEEEIHIGIRTYDDGNFRFRHRDGTPKFPPRLCPLLHCEIWIREQIRSGVLGLDEPVFQWHYTTGNEEKNLKWTAGLLAKLVKPNNKEWGVTLRARSESVITLIDADDLQSGAQIAFLPGMLTGLPARDRAAPRLSKKDGKLWKAVDAERRRAREGGADDKLGLPTHCPYPFRLEYDRDAANPGDKYIIQALGNSMDGKFVKFNAPAEVLEILESPAPPIDHLLVPREGDCDRLYNAMVEGLRGANLARQREGKSEIRMPIDSFFANWNAELSRNSGNGSDGSGYTQDVGTTGVSNGGTQLVPCSDTECNMMLDPAWSLCPKCEENASGNDEPAGWDELVASGAAKCRCNTCSMLVDLAVDQCPGCGADPNAEGAI